MKYKFLYGEDIKKDLKDKGWTSIAMWTGKKKDSIYAGDVPKEIFEGGEDVVANYIKNGSAYELMLKHDAERLGKKGGDATLKKYGKKKMTEWGKRGGRPKKNAS